MCDMTAVCLHVNMHMGQAPQSTVPSAFETLHSHWYAREFAQQTLRFKRKTCIDLINNLPGLLIHMRPLIVYCNILYKCNENYPVLQPFIYWHLRCKQTLMVWPKIVTSLLVFRFYDKQLHGNIYVHCLKHKGLNMVTVKPCVKPRA